MVNIFRCHQQSAHMSQMHISSSLISPCVSFNSSTFFLFRLQICNDRFSHFFLHSLSPPSRRCWKCKTIRLHKIERKILFSAFFIHDIFVNWRLMTFCYAMNFSFHAIEEFRTINFILSKLNIVIWSSFFLPFSHLHPLLLLRRRLRHHPLDCCCIYHHPTKEAKSTRLVKHPVDGKFHKFRHVWRFRYILQTSTQKMRFIEMVSKRSTTKKRQ